MAFLRPLLLLWLALLCLPGVTRAQTFPPLTGRVVDAANLLQPAQKQALEQKLAGIEQDTGHQLVVATLPSLEGRDIADYGYRLGRAWGIGAKGVNDGAILIVAPNERHVRIEVGRGLEGVLTDGLSALIIVNEITPRFKQGDFAGGINAGVDQIAPLLTLTPEEARARAEAMRAKAQQGEQQQNAIGALLFFGFIFFIFILPMLLSRRGGRRYRGMGGIPPVIIWGPGTGSGWSNSGGSSWDSGSSWGGGDGGGFSGGGGDFGGGGASGDW